MNIQQISREQDDFGHDDPFWIGNVRYQGQIHPAYMCYAHRSVKIVIYREVVDDETDFVYYDGGDVSEWDRIPMIYYPHYELWNEKGLSDTARQIYDCNFIKNTIIENTNLDEQMRCLNCQRERNCNYKCNMRNTQIKRLCLSSMLEIC